MEGIEVGIEEVMVEEPVPDEPTSILKTEPKKARSEKQKIAFAACKAKLSETRRLRKELKLKKKDEDSKIKSHSPVSPREEVVPKK